MAFSAASRSTMLAIILLISVALSSATSAATCDRGKPDVSHIPLANFYCHCFDTDPQGTQVFTYEQLTVEVQTPKTGFEYPYSYDAHVTCDATHLSIADPIERGIRHTYPLRESSVSIGPGGELPVLPKDQPNLRMIRLTLLGHARYITTI